MAIKMGIAYALINENLKSQAPFLDLGNCGLSDDAPELELLAECVHLKGLSLGKYYYTAMDTSIKTINTGDTNVLKIVPRSLPVQLERLYLNLTSLQSLAGLERYPHLKMVDAYGNYVTTVTETTQNRELRSLGLSNNNIEFLDGIEELIHLESLYLGQNDLRKRTLGKINMLPRLKELFLYKNGLTNLRFLLDNKTISRLDVQGNALQSESKDEIMQLVYLDQLTITNNPITKEIPKEILNTNNALDLRRFFKGCTLARILIDESNIKKDPFLDLGNCGLVDNSRELEELKKCMHLSSLSLGSEYYPTAEKVIASKNKLLPNNLTSIPAMLPQSLKELQIRNSAIQRITNIEHLKTLTVLDLSGNELQEVGNLSYLPQLTELALHQNKITSISGAQFPGQLQILHLSSNKIEDLTGIEQAKNLQQLYIFSNQIKKIAPIVALNDLQILRISDNPISDCPAEIANSSDIRQIQAFFNGELNTQATKNVVPHDEKDCKDVKLIILGNSSTGKTNLIHYLESGGFLNRRASTHGLQVKRWAPNKELFPDLANIEVSTWDFGGQEYYHDAYRLFLSNDAVYVILWCSDSDLNTQKQETTVDGQPQEMISHFEKGYWLDTVKHYTGANINTPVLLVQNKVDEEKHKYRVAQALHDQYSINESFHISIKNGVEKTNKYAHSNLNTFTNYLAEKLLTVANANAQHSEEFKKVRTELLKLNNPEDPGVFKARLRDNLFITLEEFKKACIEDLQITCSTEYFPTWLHKGGTVVYFENNPSLKERVFINPILLSEKIYNILNSKVLKNNGELCEQEVGPDEKILIDVMKNMELLYDYPSKAGYYLAPQYLPEEHPIEDLFAIASGDVWKDSFWIKMPVFFYKKVMHYLLIKFINDDTYRAKHFWKNGIIALKNGQKILIKGLYKSDNEGIIQINVQNGDAALQKELFNTILEFGRNTEDLKNQQITSSPYLDSLQLSVDKVKFDFFQALKALAGNQTDDRENLLMKYKDILPFQLAGIVPKNIFVSYSHKNTPWLAKIRNHLAGLKRGNYIREWTDQAILPGEGWDKKIKEQLEKADIYILLLSAEFIASDYSWETELKEIFTQKLKLGKQIIPIYVEYCDLTAIPSIQLNSDSKAIKINDFEIIPKDEHEQLKPISAWANEAHALSVVAARIRAAVMTNTSLPA